MKLCNCGEVIYTFQGKDFVICPKCKEPMFVNENENKSRKIGGHFPSKSSRKKTSSLDNH